MAAKSGENWNFSPLHRTFLYHPVGQKFIGNSSICYGFRDIDTFSCSTKIQDGHRKWRKLKFPPLCTEDSCTTLRVKNSLEIALSLTVFEILTPFHFPQKSKMAAESGENWNFPPLHRRLLYHPVDQRFAQNRSISYSFRDIDTFPVSAKIQDGRRKWRKLKFFPFVQDTLVPPCGSKICSKSLYLLRFSRYWHFSIFRENPRRLPKVAKFKFPSFAQETLVPPCGSKIHSKSLYLLRFSRYWQFSIFHENPRWPPKVTKIEIIPLSTGDSCTTLQVKNSLEIALSLTVFEILTLFHFPQKSKMAAESGENWNFPPLHRTLFVPHCGSKIRSKSLYLFQFSRYWHFFIFRKNPRWPPKVAKI